MFYRLFLFFFFTAPSLFAQQKYWVEFTTKDTVEYQFQSYLSPKAIENRLSHGISLYQFSDIPVSKSFIESIKPYAERILVKSRWLNSVSVLANEDQIASIQKFPFVKSVVPISNNIRITSNQIKPNPQESHPAFEQMQGNYFIQDSLSGKNVIIGIIDAGFYGAEKDNDGLLDHLFNEKNILGQRDFIASDRKDLINEKATESDTHGASVLQSVAGYNTKKNYQQGLAPNAQFYLARTEHGDREFRGEEDYWVEAMEWMDQLGIRLINTSLGYSIKMDDPLDNYKKEEMNGKTARITRAANIAFYEKGIFVVVSAGNEGSNSNWGIISAPADAEGVLSVGATLSDNCMRIYYSSMGPEFLPYNKPNVAVYSPNGTSFSSPAVCGFVACLMQKAPHLTNKEIKSIVEKSSLLYPYGNNYIGYGFPLASRALELINDSTKNVSKTTLIEVKGPVFHKKIETTEVSEYIFFNKKSSNVVINQGKSVLKKNRIIFKRPKATLRSTLILNDMVFEIVWK